MLDGPAVEHLCEQLLQGVIYSLYQTICGGWAARERYRGKVPDAELAATADAALVMQLLRGRLATLGDVGRLALPLCAAPVWPTAAAPPEPEEAAPPELAVRTGSAHGRSRNSRTGSRSGRSRREDGQSHNAAMRSDPRCGCAARRGPGRASPSS